jgi:hypothetical protein
VTLIREFLRDVDGAWMPTASPKIPLRIIGSTALMLQASYERGTKDSDVLETVDLRGDTRTRLEAIAGRGSKLHVRHKLYVDIVSGALPFLAPSPRWLEVPDLNPDLTSFHVQVLDVVDVVVSKLKRFHAFDLQDIEAMVERGFVDHGVLIERFREAVDGYLLDARAEDLPKYVANLHQVERDLFGVPETAIELPGWLDDS